VWRSSIPIGVYEIVIINLYKNLHLPGSSCSTNLGGGGDSNNSGGDGAGIVSDGVRVPQGDSDGSRS
jgi:hypothetical protein